MDDKALLNERRWWPIGERGGSFWCRWFGVGDPLRFTAGEFFLNSVRQLILALRCDEGIFAGQKNGEVELFPQTANQDGNLTGSQKVALAFGRTN